MMEDDIEIRPGESPTFEDALKRIEAADKETYQDGLRRIMADMAEEGREEEETNNV